MTRATGDNKDSGNARRNDGRTYPMSCWAPEHFIFQGLCPQFVVMLASPGARGVFVRALAVQAWIYSIADE